MACKYFMPDYLSPPTYGHHHKYAKNEELEPVSYSVFIFKNYLNMNIQTISD